MAKRVNPPITKIGHVLKNVFSLSYFSAQHKDVGVLFCKYFMTFLIICPVANAISLNWIPCENGHFFKQFSQVVVYFTLVGRGVRWFPKEFWWVYQTHNNSSYTLIFWVKWCWVLLIFFPKGQRYHRICCFVFGIEKLSSYRFLLVSWDNFSPKIFINNRNRSIQFEILGLFQARHFLPKKISPEFFRLFVYISVPYIFIYCWEHWAMGE